MRGSEMLGSTVSHYRILDEIGEGGMGVVYLAEDLKLHRQVALKVLPDDLTRDEARKQRFVQEASTAAAIEHPHIAVIHEIDEIDGRTFIAMEYVRGQSLRRVIRDRKLTPRKTLEIAGQIASGLAKAHEHGVVHRDLKPENVLVTEEGYAKIIDFGLAKLLEPVAAAAGAKGEASELETELKVRTHEGHIVGTVAYMSPEQVRDLVIRAGFPAAGSDFIDAFFLSRAGRYREADNKLRAGAQLAARNKDALGEATLWQLASMLALERRDYAAARQAALRIERLAPQIQQPRPRQGLPMHAAMLAAIADVGAGRLDEARRRLESQATGYDRTNLTQIWWYHAAQGETALAAGDLAAAEAAFAAGQPPIKVFYGMNNPSLTVISNNALGRDGPARVRKARRDLPGAIAIYRRLLAPDGDRRWTAALEPRYVLELARRLEETGELAGARREYERFLDLWKRADPGLPELDEAKRKRQSLITH